MRNINTMATLSLAKTSPTIELIIPNKPVIIFHYKRF